MTHPAVIRTDFASAEDVAATYGLPERRVKTIQKALTKGKYQTTMPGKRRGAVSTKTASRGKKHIATKK